MQAHPVVNTVVVWLHIHSHTTTVLTTHLCILMDYFTTVTLVSTNNTLPDDGVTAPKHVGAVLM